MNITFTFYPVYAPLALTAIIWAAALLWPVKKSRSDYDFSPVIDGLMHGVAGLIATLVVWLVFVTYLLVSA